MGDRETCYVCKNYSYEILNKFRNGEECPFCGASFETSDAIRNAEAMRQQYKNKKLSAELTEEITQLRKENAMLKENLKMRHKYSFEIEDALEMCLETFKKMQEVKAIKD